MKNLKRSAVMLAMLVAMSSVLVVSGQSNQTQTNSAESSRSLDTRVDGGTASDRYGERRPEGRSPSAHHGGKPQGKERDESRALNACAAAVEELKGSRRLIELLDRENALLKERVETEKQAAAMLVELNETRKAESEALRITVAAKNETIVAKEAVIASQDKLIENLKAKKSSPWKRLGDVLIGVAAGMVLR